MAKIDNTDERFKLTDEETRKKFLSIRRTGGTILDACRGSGIGKSSYYRYVEDHPEFEEDCEMTREQSIQELRQGLFDIAKQRDSLHAAGEMIRFGLERLNPDPFAPSITHNINAVLEDGELDELPKDALKNRVSSLLNQLTRKRKKKDEPNEKTTTDAK